MTDCRECPKFPCFIVKINKGEPYEHCLGPVILNPYKPEKGRKEILRKIKNIGSKPIKLEWET